jgi:ABC-type sugar transport system ATPase subunit
MIELRRLHLQAGLHRLDDISLTIQAGEYAILMGRTGSGKTTILEALCGLRPVQGGQILINGNDVTHWTPAARQIGYVPQDGALFVNLNVRQHLEFALKLRRYPPSAMQRRVDELAEVLGIGHLLTRGVGKLSGGEAQRVALGRALSFSPKVLLLDEPLSALDEATRREMYTLLRRVQQATGVTTLHVTHSREEAQYLADRLFQLDQAGMVEQTSQLERRLT